ncbi:MULTISPECIES: hypothetical protein [Leptolyngbya]|uniref:hypothetical protein n=1 Tax=Leptolyngbya TaxID=47251 RepID=UPI0016869DC7|nr:hypothetical protein [Leptolyngbya sp. FACHB-1624]MBD1854069.1 hypothetical protein [Leptolyngbya sp. FACHB-1624]
MYRQANPPRSKAIAIFYDQLGEAPLHSTDLSPSKAAIAVLKRAIANFASMIDLHLLKSPVYDRRL